RRLLTAHGPFGFLLRPGIAVQILSSTPQGRPISRKNFAHHRNATMSVGLDDRSVAEVDLDAERRLDICKVRDQHRVGASLRLFSPGALRVARHVDKLRYHKGAVPRP